MAYGRAKTPPDATGDLCIYIPAVDGGSLLTNEHRISLFPSHVADLFAIDHTPTRRATLANPGILPPLTLVLTLTLTLTIMLIFQMMLTFARALLVGRPFSLPLFFPLIVSLLVLGVIIIMIRCLPQP